MIVLLQSDLPGGYGVALLQTILALGAVCVLAWVVLRWSAKHGLGVGGRRVKVLERVPLDARRSLYLVSIGERVFLIGGGEGASPSVLAELDPDELPAVPERPASFAELVARVRGKREPTGASPTDE
jgi:flagellar protein FliO/FliZ